VRPEEIMSMKNSKDIIGNRTRDLPACSAVPQHIGGNIAILLILLVLHAGNVFLCLVDTRKIRQTRCSLHFDVSKSASKQEVTSDNY
jgi:hypothetical protein